MKKVDARKIAEVAVAKAMANFELRYNESYRKNFREYGDSSAAGRSMHENIQSLLVDAIAFAIEEYNHK